jgi:hypothetical protein
VLEPGLEAEEDSPSNTRSFIRLLDTPVNSVSLTHAHSLSISVCGSSAVLISPHPISPIGKMIIPTPEDIKGWKDAAYDIKERSFGVTGQGHRVLELMLDRVPGPVAWMLQKILCIVDCTQKSLMALYESELMAARSHMHRQSIQSDIAQLPTMLRVAMRLGWIAVISK